MAHICLIDVKCFTNKKVHLAKKIYASGTGCWVQGAEVPGTRLCAAAVVGWFANTRKN